MARSVNEPMLFDPDGDLINADDIVTAPPQPRRGRAHCEVYFAGRNITDQLDPYLISMRIADRENMSTASMLIDDRYGKFALPDDGKGCYIRLGWPGEASARVFNGSMADIVSNGSRRSGRTLSLEFTGADMLGTLKETTNGTWGGGKDAPSTGGGGGADQIAFSVPAQAIAERAGLTLRIGGSLGSVKRSFWSISGESPMSWLKRTAEELGGQLKIEGTEAAIVDLSGIATAGGVDFPTVDCTVGTNVLAWGIKPRITRAQWSAAAHGFFDRDKAAWQTVMQNIAGGFGFGNSKARIAGLFPVNEEAMAKTASMADATVSVRERGSGWIVIDGEPTAQALGQCSINGTRPGVDGTYRIVEVEHTYFRGGGFVSRLDVNNPTLTASPSVTGAWASTP